MRRVVVTGIGMVSPLAGDVETTWSRLLDGKSGAVKLTKFDTTDYKCKVACEVPYGDGSDGTFDPDKYVPAKERRRIDNFITLGLSAAAQAIADSGWEPQSDEDHWSTGVLIGSGIGGLPSIEKNSVLLNERGPRKISPFFIPGSLINLVSGMVSIKYGYKGPNHAVVTACSTGAHAIGDASRMVALGDADVMIAGGTEATICPIGFAGFLAARTLSTNFNDDPTAASRPYDKDRDGFVMGEGAGIVVLEELEHAKARGAKIYAEVAGYGMSGDAHHITSPAPDGDGAYRCMKVALGRANVDAGDLDYVNAHGTSTPVGDEIELRALERLLDGKTDNVSVSSTKSAIGHLLGAAGAVEAIFGVLSIRDNVVPPTLNLNNPSVETDIDLVPLKAKEKTVNTVLSNSFGFGGTNASLVMRRFNA